VSEETRQKTRILLADGHHMVRQGIRQLLERKPDFEVVGETDNGVEAVRLAHELKPDMIIMEARMPRLDSVEVIKRLKTGEQPEAVLILTTYEDEDQTVELLKAGANGCIFKTAPSDELVQAIRMVRAGQFVCDPLVEKKLLKHAVRSSPVALDFGEHLTRREAEVLKLAARGLNNRDIAARLGLAERTVKGHLMNIFDKLGVSSRTEAVREALKRGWVSLEDE
jgi:DNA-binding NarL/FixJ family response regulator